MGWRGAECKRVYVYVVGGKEGKARGGGQNSSWRLRATSSGEGGWLGGGCVRSCCNLSGRQEWVAEVASAHNVKWDVAEVAAYRMDTRRHRVHVALRTDCTGYRLVIPRGASAFHIMAA